MFWKPWFNAANDFSTFDKLPELTGFACTFDEGLAGLGLPKGVGAFDDIGGKAALAEDAAAELVGCFAFPLPPKGVGALVDIGGNDELFLGVVKDFALPPNGVGAFEDIGGKAELLEAAALGLLPPPLPNGVGAFADIGGKVDVDFDGAAEEGFD